eukprot:11733-Heterococcus_DN1.PRE.3
MHNSTTPTSTTTATTSSTALSSRQQQCSTAHAGNVHAAKAPACAGSAELNGFFGPLVRPVPGGSFPRGDYEGRVTQSSLLTEG